MQLTAYCKGLLHAIREHTPQLTKMWLVMRITVILLTVAALQVSARGYSQKTITMSLHQTTLEKALTEIKKQSGYYVIYGRSEVARAALVNIHVENEPLESVLTQLLAGQPLDYRISDKFIIIAPKEELTINGTSPDEETAPPGEIHGRVVNEKGEQMTGASIFLRGSRKGILSNSDGSFIFHNLHPGDQLVVSFTGYQSIVLILDESSFKNFFHVALKPSADPIDEVQIIAYGSTTRRLNLGNVTTIRSEDIEKQPVDNLILALQGRVPGMQISAIGNSLPGAAPTVKIRGTNSIAAGTSPLYILDGVPIPETQSAITGISTSESALMSVNPAEIESIEVLKDADATSIYGSRGANGVVLITTKKGKIGRTAVSANFYTGFSKVGHFIDFLNVHQYNAMRREALANDKLTPNTSNAADLLTYDSTKVTDWQKFFIGGSAPTTDATVSVGGGNLQTRFNATVGYHKEGTTFPGNSTGADRKSVRLSVDHNSADGKFGLSATSGYSISTLDLIATDLTSNITFAPDYPLYTAAGTPNWSGFRGYPLGYLNQPFNSKTDNYNGHVLFRYTPVRGLNLKIDAGFNNSQINQSQQVPLSAQDPASAPVARLTVGSVTNKTWIAEPQADYTLNIDRHQVTLLAGGTWQQNDNRSLTSIGTNFPNDALIGNIGSASTISAYSSTTLYNYVAFFSRLNYNWDQRYLLNLSFRRDGSSRFGPGKRFGNFGAVSAGWIFTRESFMQKGLPFISFGKLRASYGTNGNDQINEYGYISTYGNGGLYQTSSLIPATLANPDYRWEQDRKLEFGLELGALKNRILLNTSVFRNRTNNQLINFVLSPQTGFGSYQANFPALLQNQGIEIELNTKNIVTKDFTWSTSINFTRIANKLLSFPNISQTAYSSQYIVGKSLNLVQAYQFMGLDTTGKPVLADRDKDGSITTNDRIVMGKNDPLFGGMMNSFTYKGIGLNFFWEYTHINGFNNAIPASRIGAQGTNPTTLPLNRWQHRGDEAFTSTPLFTTSAATYNARFYSQSSVAYTKSNIYRLRNASLTYNLPAGLLKKMKIQRLQLYMLGQNLWVSDPWKKYRLDPETGNGGMPPLRTLTFGINCTF
jgi:TonB-linked SusC/RagA family outer membrane protein